MFYLTVAAVILMSMLWYGFEHNRFERVREGKKIVRCQKMIAELEKKYDEGDECEIDESNAAPCIDRVPRFFLEIEGTIFWALIRERLRQLPLWWTSAAS